MKYIVPRAISSLENELLYIGLTIPVENGELTGRL